MEINYLKMNDEVALEYFSKLYTIFQKFINNEIGIKVLYGEPFDINKVDEVHNKTMDEYRSMDSIQRNAKKKLVYLTKYIEHLLYLQKSGILFSKLSWNMILNRYNNLQQIVKNDYEVDIFDYYFMYKGKYYAVEMGTDLDSFGLCINNQSKNILYCEIREFNEYMECDDTKKYISFLYDKENNKVLDILSVSLYGKNENGEKFVKNNNNSNLLIKTLNSKKK